MKKALLLLRQRDQGRAFMRRGASNMETQAEYFAEPAAKKSLTLMDRIRRLIALKEAVKADNLKLTGEKSEIQALSADVSKTMVDQGMMGMDVDGAKLSIKHKIFPGAVDGDMERAATALLTAAPQYPDLAEMVAHTVTMSDSQYQAMTALAKKNVMVKRLLEGERKISINFEAVREFMEGLDAQEIPLPAAFDGAIRMFDDYPLTVTLPSTRKKLSGPRNGNIQEDE
jgi:hypothetical protein